MFIKPVLAAQQQLENLYVPATSLGGSNAKLANLITPLIKNALIVSGLVAFMVIIFAGFNYISGAGDKNKLAQSTQMLNYAILGLIVVTSAFLIVRIIGAVLGFKFF